MHSMLFTLFQSEWSEVLAHQATRLNCMSQACQGQGPTKRRDLGRMLLVHDKYQIIFCSVPKVGSTTWKRVLGILSHNVTEANIMEKSLDLGGSNPSEYVHTQHFYNRIGLKPLSRYSLSESIWRLQNYFKFMFVRHPLERLTSAYKDKFLTPSPRPFFKLIRQYIRKHFAFKGDIPFNVFLRFVISDHKSPKVSTVTEDHWQTFDQLCSPCFVKYDFIGHLETFQEDSQFLLKNVLGYTGGQDDISRLFNPVHGPVSKNAKPVNYDQVPGSLLKQIQTVFEEDSKLFCFDGMNE